MLLVDRMLVTPEDLAAAESEVPRIAEELGVQLDGDMGVCALATGQAIHQILAHARGAWLGGLGSTPAHMAAVWNTGGGSSWRPEISPAQVLLDSMIPATPSPLRLWGLLLGLEMFYRAAANRRARDDRYQDKHAGYAFEARQAWARLQRAGLPVVVRPFPRPGAALWPNAGTWGAGNVSLVAASGGSTGEYEVRISWRDVAGQYSAPSEPVRVVLDGSKAISVSIGTLRPPRAELVRIGAAAPGVVPYEAREWVVWAGPAGGTLRLQAWADVSVSEITLSPTMAAEGLEMQPGQDADAVTMLLPTLWRV